jgi:hypothetical protein
MSGTGWNANARAAGSLDDPAVALQAGSATGPRAVLRRMTSAPEHELPQCLAAGDGLGVQGDARRVLGPEQTSDGPSLPSRVWAIDSL